jgi:hypothetical protein
MARIIPLLLALAENGTRFFIQRHYSIQEAIRDLITKQKQRTFQLYPHCIAVFLSTIVYCRYRDDVYFGNTEKHFQILLSVVVRGTMENGRKTNKLVTDSVIWVFGEEWPMESLAATIQIQYRVLHYRVFMAQIVNRHPLFSTWRDSCSLITSLVYYRIGWCVRILSANNPDDVVFLFDASSKVGKDNLEKMKKFAINVIRQLSGDESHPRWSVLSFVEKANPHAWLKQCEWLKRCMKVYGLVQK